MYTAPNVPRLSKDILIFKDGWEYQRQIEMYVGGGIGSISYNWSLTLVKKSNRLQQAANQTQ